ncbi:MAG: glycosyltransferase [Zymomonas mobilis]|uniref:glycosyltransferase n=4 Tax=Bacteria TaxID=2 RepID=UPI0001B703C6|nr:glycosyltransferase family 1 protein [Zymomonas mobilis]ACV74656.1 glycosyl transferase group 1 [Zymomonas mobilis subsp. mobilis NCIMB 11163]
MKFNLKNFSFAHRKAYQGQHRNLGDQARDSKNWETAIYEYRKHLSLYPSDQAIWVQLGHALKEKGDFNSSIEAYYKSIEITDDDEDAYLHLIHLLIRMNLYDKAFDATKKALMLSQNKEIYDIAIVLGVPIHNLNLLEKRRDIDKKIKYIIEIDDLLDYLRNHKTPSGIQRVQIGIVRHIIESDKNNIKKYAFVRTGKYNTGFWRLPFDSILKILDYLKILDPQQDVLTSLIESAERNSLLIEPQKGQIYLILGAFWRFGANASRYTYLKKAGVLVGVYIYDIIPISYPEYCAAGLVSEFTLALGDGLYSFDFIFTISNFVAEDIKKLQIKNNLKKVPVSPVLLAHQLHDNKIKIAEKSEWGKLEFLKKRPFVLMVSTIEARKNHVYLYMAWKSLIEAGINPPDLVFVGRFGWRMNDFKSMVEDTGFLEDRIHILHDLSDADLEVLYRECEFTVFPSIVEGWGLPVGESLSHGRPCIASNTSSIPEVGGELVDYIDPYNLHSGLEVFKKFIIDTDYRIQRVKEIKEKFCPRMWQDVGNELMAQLRVLEDKLPNPYVPPTLDPAEFFQPEEFAIGEKIPHSYLKKPMRPLLAECWYGSEKGIGSWMRGKEGNICFSTRLDPGTDIIVYLEILTPPWTNHELFIYIGENNYKQKHNSFQFSVNEKRFIKISGQVSPDRTVLINFYISGDTVSRHPNKNNYDTREFYIGLKTLVYTRKDNSKDRISILEKFSL